MEFYERVSGARMHAAFHKIENNFNFLINDNYFRAIPPDLEFKSMVVQSLFSIS